MQADPEAAALMAKMLRKRLFVAIRSPLALSRAGALLARHLRWAIDAEARGEIFLSGPFVGGGSPGERGGMTVLRAESEQAARAIMDNDPFVAESVYTYELREWMLMEGSVSLNFTFSNGAIKVF
ncbi:hypothetical protein BJN34_09680 [Cupriavidus necator]|uniref:YCII-related domain-containing protein n=1 Tax=Cupriavidus necator TaxID=106590 RepID=A0A1U9UND3_CUPNE|nr:YciI family protein [Cupriavidus necator]AQV94158.1 hypothetical protein BJN34_09680 [Cupriavidus necator]